MGLHRIRFQTINYNQIKTKQTVIGNGLVLRFAPASSVHSRDLTLHVYQFLPLPSIQQPFSLSPFL